MSGVDERDLELDLFATQRRSGGQGRDLVKRACKLLDGFDQRRARQRPLSGLAPQTRSFLDQASLSAVTRQNLRLVFGDFSEVAFESFGDAGMQARVAALAAACRRLHPAPARA